MIENNGGIASACDYNGLIAGTEPSAQVTAVEIVLGEKAFPAGTVLTMAGAATAYTPASAALTADTLVLVAAEEIPAGEGKMKVCCYKAGCFVRNKLAGNGTYKLTAKDFKFLGQAGIASQGDAE